MQNNFDEQSLLISELNLKNSENAERLVLQEKRSKLRADELQKDIKQLQTSLSLKDIEISNLK